MGSEPDRYFSKEDIPMATSSMKTRSASLIIKVMWIKTAIKYHITPASMAFIAEKILRGKKKPVGRQSEIRCCFMHDSPRNTYTELLHLKLTVQWSVSRSLVSDTDLNPGMSLTFRDGTVTVCPAPITWSACPPGLFLFWMLCRGAGL